MVLDLRQVQYEGELRLTVVKQAELIEQLKVECKRLQEELEKLKPKKPKKDN